MTDNELKEAIATHIRDWCAERGLSMAEASRQAGKSHTWLEKLCRMDGTGHKAVMQAHEHIGFPPEVIAASEARSRRVAKERAAKISRLKQERDECGGGALYPWTRTVAQFKQQPPIYARAWG